MSSQEDSSQSGGQNPVKLSVYGLIIGRIVISYLMAYIVAEYHRRVKFKRHLQAKLGLIGGMLMIAGTTVQAASTAGYPSCQWRGAHIISNGCFAVSNALLLFHLMAKARIVCPRHGWTVLQVLIAIVITLSFIEIIVNSILTDITIKTYPSGRPMCEVRPVAQLIITRGVLWIAGNSMAALLFLSTLLSLLEQFTGRLKKSTQFKVFLSVIGKGRKGIEYMHVCIDQEHGPADGFMDRPISRPSCSQSESRLIMVVRRSLLLMIASLSCTVMLYTGYFIVPDPRYKNIIVWSDFYVGWLWAVLVAPMPTKQERILLDNSPSQTSESCFTEDTRTPNTASTVGEQRLYAALLHSRKEEKWHSGHQQLDAIFPLRKFSTEGPS